MKVSIYDNFCSVLKSLFDEESHIKTKKNLPSLLPLIDKNSKIIKQLEIWQQLQQVEEEAKKPNAAQQQKVNNKIDEINTDLINKVASMNDNKSSYKDLCLSLGGSDEVPKTDQNYRGMLDVLSVLSKSAMAQNTLYTQYLQKMFEVQDYECDVFYKGLIMELLSRAERSVSDMPWSDMPWSLWSREGDKKQRDDIENVVKDINRVLFALCLERPDLKNIVSYQIKNITNSRSKSFFLDNWGEDRIAEFSKVMPDEQDLNDARALQSNSTLPLDLPQEVVAIAEGVINTTTIIKNNQDKTTTYGLEKDGSNVNIASLKELDPNKYEISILPAKPEQADIKRCFASIIDDLKNKCNCEDYIDLALKLNFDDIEEANKTYAKDLIELAFAKAYDNASAGHKEILKDRYEFLCAANNSLDPDFLNNNSNSPGTCMELLHKIIN